MKRKKIHRKTNCPDTQNEEEEENERRRSTISERKSLNTRILILIFECLQLHIKLSDNYCINPEKETQLMSEIRRVCCSSIAIITNNNINKPFVKIRENCGNRKQMAFRILKFRCKSTKKCSLIKEKFDLQQLIIYYSKWNRKIEKLKMCSCNI